MRLQEIKKTYREYWPAVGRFWWLFVIGGLLGLLSLVERIGGWDVNLPFWTVLVFTFTGLAAAQFMAFHAIRMERDSLRDLRDYNAAIDGLSDMLSDGNSKILNDPLVTNENDFGWWYQRYLEWHESVAKFLSEQFGKREENLFRNVVVFEYILNNGVSKEHIKHRNIVVHKLGTLREIIIRHSSGASKWHEKMK